MKGRFWLWLGVALGVAVAAGRLPYLSGAGRSLAGTAERLVLSASHWLISRAASAGAPRRVVLVAGALVAVALPGVTALLLILAARGTLRVRAIVAVLVVALGAAGFAYLPHGRAAGVLVLALAVAGVAVAVTGPLVAAPLALGAGLLGGEFLPALVSGGNGLGQGSVNAVHTALYDRPGTPLALQVALLAVAAVPFALAARLVIRD